MSSHKALGERTRTQRHRIFRYRHLAFGIGLSRHDGDEGQVNHILAQQMIRDRRGGVDECGTLFILFAESSSSLGSSANMSSIP